MNQAFDPIPGIVDALKLPLAGVRAVVGLLAENATVPFIARYRKEATGNLDEVAIRAIQETRATLMELDARRQTVLASITEQGKLTPSLRSAIEACTTRAALEDLYLPYKPKRKTRASAARDRGLGPLAERILQQPRDGSPRADARRFVDPKGGVPDVDAALAGARDICAEALNENADVRRRAREALQQHGVLVAKATKAAKASRTRFEQYYDFGERVARIPSHRYLAVARGEADGALRVKVEVDVDRLLPQLERIMGLRNHSPYADELRAAIADGYKRLLARSVANDIRAELKVAADDGAIDVFAKNLADLLLAAPLGAKTVIGIDPGLRTGCKCAVVDATGQMKGHETIYLSSGAEAKSRAADTLRRLVRTHKPFALAVGNGTGGRETEAFCREVLDDSVLVVSVNEAGASIYSASDVARAEFPNLDLTIRGAISIARRLQDPLAELVKLEPKSIGVGQYQHDVDQRALQRSLDAVIEDCVNGVGVELNTASAPLLARVAGIGPKLAERIVTHRDTRGRYRRRADLKAVKGLGARTFEQCAGFLRIQDGGHPLDASAVHPERYALVEQMARDLGVGLSELVGNAEQAKKLEISRYVSGGVGRLTLLDIQAELARPGRDPRADFEPPKFRDDVHSIKDLETGMILEGVVTNVTHFGAFVDIGVHQDGLVHISELSKEFVRDPHSVVHAGSRITVMVLGIDEERKRISLSAKAAME